jgi:uncharacterized protein YecE (DUF72 family)
VSRAGRILIGVAGWDYPDWAGVVYPARASSRGFDRLAFVARFVDLVEINSTFYRPADPRTAASWIRRTRERPEFRFSAKAHRSWTHDREADLEAAVRTTVEGLAPLREAGVLAALLVQFPQSFHRRAEAFVHLERILERVEGWPMVVELRHASWDRDEAAAWFRERGAGWCVVDQPRVGGSTAPARPRVTSRVGYLRLHGRNRADWFREDAGRDARYDYLYSLEELGPLAEAATTMAHEVDTLAVVQNNHFRGQALANALQMRHLIRGDRPEAPAALAAAYPGLAAITTSRREQLF